MCCFDPEKRKNELMTHPSFPEHGHSTSPSSQQSSASAGQLHFPAAEWAEFQAEDVHAAKAVVGLMMSIFTIGLLLYSGVALSIIL
jgi:hypothetical protein